MADLALIYESWKSRIGQRVYVKNSIFGTLKYFGEIKFKDGFWCGVELDKPVGDNDGMINNIKYFKCKAKYGIFVPVSETARLKSTSSKVNHVCDLIKLKHAGSREKLPSTEVLSSTFSQNMNSAKLEMGNEINKKIQSRKSRDLNKTFSKNELKNIPDAFCFKVPRERLHTDYVVNKKYENVSKRSKSTCGRLDTEESLGIISALLDEEESWNLLDQSTANGIGKKCLIQKLSDKIDMDSVFYPLAETSHLSSGLNLYTEQVDSFIPSCSNSKYTSTPKRFFSNAIDLNRTMKLNDKPSCDFFHDEPIVAGSSKLNFETDFDLVKFEQSDILCSTLKCSLSSLPIQYTASGEISCINNDELAKSINKTPYQQVRKLNEEKNEISTLSNACTKQFASNHKGCIAENSSILNTTFIINPDSLSSSHASTSLIPHAVHESDSFHSDRKSSSVIHMDSTFATHDNFTEKVLEGEKTFIIDCSPMKIPKALSLECETNAKKKPLSTIFEKTDCNVDINGLAESEDEPSNTANNENLISFKLSSEDRDQVIKGSSLSKIATSDPNSTFCISSNDSMNKKNTPYLDVKKRYNLSSISVKNSVCIKKEKTVITSFKANGQKSITQSRLSILTKKKSLQSSNCTNSPSSLKQFKDIKLRDENAEVTSASKFLEMMPKRKLKKTCSTIVESSSDMAYAREPLKKTCFSLVESSSDIAYAREQLKKSLGSCKSVNNVSVKKENESRSILKINKTNSKVVERRKGASNLPTKVIPKMSFNCKVIAPEYSNLNCKVNESKGSRESKLKTPIDVKLDIYKYRHSMLPTDLENSEKPKIPTDVKLGNVKRRHSMLPTVLANSTRTKYSASKDGSDVKCIKNAVKFSFAFTESKSVPPSKIHQDGFGNKRLIERELMEKKSVSAEKVFETNSNIKCAKKNENSTVLKSKLLKPGTLSRLPVTDKLSKEPGCILNSVDPQSQHTIKSVNKIDNQRIYRRSPFQKLQNKH